MRFNLKWVALGAAFFVAGVLYQRLSAPNVSGELGELRSALEAMNRGRADGESPATKRRAERWQLRSHGNALDREALREELAAALNDLQLKADGKSEEEEVRAAQEELLKEKGPPTAEMETLNDKATEYIDDAVIRGTWTSDDRTEFRRMAESIDHPTLQFELYRRMSELINDGTLKPGLDGPPL